jgi:hypothetical protein
LNAKLAGPTKSVQNAGLDTAANCRRKASPNTHALRRLLMLIGVRDPCDKVRGALSCAFARYCRIRVCHGGKRGPVIDFILLTRACAQRLLLLQGRSRPLCAPRGRQKRQQQNLAMCTRPSPILEHSDHKLTERIHPRIRRDRNAPSPDRRWSKPAILRAAQTTFVNYCTCLPRDRRLYAELGDSGRPPVPPS